MAQLLKRIASPEPAPPWGVPNALLALAAAFTAFLLGAGLLLTLTNARPDALLSGWTLGGLLTVGYVWLSRRTNAARAALRLGADAPLPALIALPLGLGLAISVDLLSGWTRGAVLPTPALEPLAASPSLVGWLVAIVFMVGVQPVAEGLVFWGVLLPAFRRAIGVWPALLLSALFYGGFHLLVFANPGGGSAQIWRTLGEPALLGGLLGAVRLWAGSTRSAIWTAAGMGLFALLKLLVLGR